MNLLSPEQKALYLSGLDCIHDTFAQPVTIWKDGERAIISQNSDDFNIFYRDSSQDSVDESFTPVSGVFNMRVQWLDPNRPTNMVIERNTDFRAKINNNLCRLKMKQDAFNFLYGYQRIDINGRACEVDSFTQPHGLVDETSYYTIYVREMK